MKSHFNKNILFVLVTVVLVSFAGMADTDVEEMWDALLKRDPFIYTVPSVSNNTTVDGTYVKKAIKEGEIVPCRRCPDWVPNPGTWRLYLNKGVYRIIHLETGWKSIGTYIVSGDRILFANDPCCINGFGVYSWIVKEHQLTFKMIDDPCAIKLRAKNLTEVSWRSCQAPNIEAAVTEHWPKPMGCD